MQSMASGRLGFVFLSIRLGGMMCSSPLYKNTYRWVDIDIHRHTSHSESLHGSSKDILTPIFIFLIVMAHV